MGSFDYGNNAAITKYTQTAVLQTSQTISVPPGTKRIEALLCGGGGGSQSVGGSGFGGCQIYNIPLTGQPLVLTVGVGGVVGSRGGTTSVSAGGVVYAAVGGGGVGTIAAAAALYGGGGGGAGPGAPPFSQANLLWSAMDVATKTGSPLGLLTGSAANAALTIGLGVNGNQTSTSKPADGAMGWGGGSGVYAPPAQVGGSGGGGGNGGGAGDGAAGGAGAGGGAAGASANAGAAGGSLANISVWGLTGFAGGAGASGGASYAGGGGGGMLSVGSAAVTTTAGSGGNGGGGGGGGSGGTGGNGFAMFRFYF